MMPDRERRTAALRLGIGVLQGFTLYALAETMHRSWAVHGGPLWAILLLWAFFLPLILLAALGRMRPVALAAWVGAAAAAIALLAFYDVWRSLPEPGADGSVPVPSAQLVVIGSAALYVVHHLIEPADETRRWIAPYPAYIEGAWRHAFQLALSLLFALVVLGVVALGAALFGGIGLAAVAAPLRSGPLNASLFGLAFAAAVHRTDVSPGIIAGVRTVGLTLFSWLLPLATGLVAAFLAALLFTGLEPLWNTRHAALLLLATAAMLIVLINAAYGDGRGGAVPALLRASTRIAGVLLVPLIALALWGLSARVGAYGLTAYRIWGFTACLVGGVYALGYGAAAAMPGPWMRLLERVNVAAAVVSVAIALLVLSPAADPARLATDDQVARLDGGRVPAADFDFAALRLNGARFGRDALVRLAASAKPPIATRAAATLAGDGAPPVADPGTPFARARVRPEGALLPAGFRDQAWPADRFRSSAGACLVSDAPCDLFAIDIDGSPAVVAFSDGPDGTGVALVRGGDGRWVKAGVFTGPRTPAVRAAIAAGAVRTQPPLLPDLEVGTTRLRFEPDFAYAAARDAARAPPQEVPPPAPRVP